MPQGLSFFRRDTPQGVTKNKKKDFTQKEKDRLKQIQLKNKNNSIHNKSKSNRIFLPLTTKVNKSKFIINEDRYGDGYECEEGDTKAYFKQSTSVCLWFDLEEARLEQAIKREQVIAEAHKRAQSALSFYNDVVLKYLNAPISNPE